RDKQEALEDVLPRLVEVEEHRGVQDLNAEPGAHERPDERPAPPEQARTAEDNGGDRGERVARALPRVTDTELCEQHNSTKQRHERRAEVAEQRHPVDEYADTACGLLARPNSAQLQPEL